MQMDIRPEPELLLARAAVAALLYSALYLALATALMRRLGARPLWATWAFVVVAAVVMGLVRLAQLGPSISAGFPLLEPYMLLAFVGIPTALGTLAVVRVGRRTPAPHAVLHFGIGLVALLVSVPVAAIIAALPDVYRLFSS